jgi:hypothetical protein
LPLALPALHGATPITVAKDVTGYERFWYNENRKTQIPNMLKWCGRAVPAEGGMPQGTRKPNRVVGGAGLSVARFASAPLHLTLSLLTTSGSGETNPAAGHRRTGGARCGACRTLRR